MSQVIIIQDSLAEQRQRSAGEESNIRTIWSASSRLKSDGTGKMSVATLLLLGIAPLIMMVTSVGAVAWLVIAVVVSFFRALSVLCR